VKIQIDWLIDDHECEECGYEIAGGAFVTFEDGDKIDMTPSANCEDKKDYSGDDVYNEILKKLGHEIKVTGL
jgi:hypothetical protein